MLRAPKSVLWLIPLLFTVGVEDAELLRPGALPALEERQAGEDPAIDAASLEAGASESWFATVSTAIRRQEYEASRGEHGLQAPNRAQNLRTIFHPQGIEVVPRQHANAESPAWRFVWETTRFGRANHMRPVAPADPRPNGAQVVYERPGLSEWYENSERGIEQGFTIASRPPGSGEVAIAGNLGGVLGLRPELRGHAVELLDTHGASVLRYAELKVFDARARDLPAHLSLTGMELAIVIDDNGAEYPLTVDPLFTSPAWIAEGDQVDAEFGTAVQTAGDVNGDGFSDVIVGAYRYDNGMFNEGKALCYLGSAAGLSATPSWTAEGNQPRVNLGHSAASAGDVNGDGYSDVIVGASAWDNGGDLEGHAYVYHGSASGLSTVSSWTAGGYQAGDLFGACVATAGDVNGDGFSDVIIGAKGHDNGESLGRAYVYHGSASGLGVAAAWTAESDLFAAFFGGSVATAGDVNGDGYADVIVGAQEGGDLYQGRAFAYHGSATGLSILPAWTLEGDRIDAQVGSSVATAGDVNGDGYSDVIVGAPAYDNDQNAEGRAYVYNGSVLGLGITPSWTTEGNQHGAFYGSSVATAGDVNGDGFADVIVGASSYTNDLFYEGRALVYYGSATGLNTAFVWDVEGDQEGALFGYPVATAGDVNGDGFSDVIVGASGFDNLQEDEGRAYVYHGSADGLGRTATWTTESNQASSELGASVAGAGDVNGDGLSDVVIGAAYYDNGQADEGRAFVYHGSGDGLGFIPAWTGESNQAFAHFGGSVASAGDVNGDGFADVIVGADGFDNGQSDEGRAYVYHGSPVGLVSSPAWVTESDQGFAYYGTQVGTAGDVNGDGFSDVIVAARFFDNGQADEGRAYVYHGTSVGLSTLPAWTGDSNQASAECVSAATAGDVNGDGFSDVIVGAHLYDNDQTDEGRAFVYHGSAVGLGAAPAATVESNQASCAFGRAVATAGDINGDGFSDVIVGAPLYNGGQIAQGIVFVYLGTPAGMGTTHTYGIVPDNAFASFGSSVATAGDVNADGYSDFIVGAPFSDDGQQDEGRVFLLEGGAFGLTLRWVVESNLANANFGQSVAGAGDVNGDGFSDVVVGAPRFHNGQVSEGTVFLYLGNASAGVGRIPRQARTDDAALISPLGVSDSPSGFRLKTSGRTPIGRGRVRLVAEVKPFGVPFDGTGLLVGPATNTGAPGGAGSVVALTQLVSGLTSDTVYHWRLRTRSDSPFFPASPWFSVAGNAVTEADLRTAPGGTGIAAGSGAPALRWLGNAAPNPFTTATEIDYALPAAGRVRLAVYDVQGRQAALLADGVRPAGNHTARWDGRDGQQAKLPAGVYFLRFEFGGQVESRKITLSP